MAENRTSILERRGVGYRLEAGLAFLVPPGSGQEIQGVSDHSKSNLAFQVVMKVYLLTIVLAFFGILKYLDL